MFGRRSPVRRKYLAVIAVFLCVSIIVGMEGGILVNAATPSRLQQILLQRVISSTSSSQSSSDPLLVKTAYGLVRGFEWDNYTYAWLGIPYAKPPVGELRWKAPQDPDPWQGVLNATSFSDIPMQIASIMCVADESYEDEIATGAVIGSEDCLYLNIWVPKAKDGKLPSNLPVFVWVYGGADISGSSSMPLYYGANLARKANAVVVTFNYRVGIEGWFYHPALKTGDPVNDSGNYGLLDIVKALEWVKKNIKNFGGNPNCITVAGESAGAMNILALITSPYVKQEFFDKGNPLFHRAILESGGIMTATLEEAEQSANLVLASLLVKRGNASSINEALSKIAAMSQSEIASLLRNADMKELYEAVRDHSGAQADLIALMTGLLPSDLLIGLLPPSIQPVVSELVDQMNKLIETIMSLVPPELISRLLPEDSAGKYLMALMNVVSMTYADGYVVAKNPYVRLRDGDYIKVPVIIGSCEEEFKFFLSMGLSDMASYLNTTFGRYIPSLSEYLEATRPWPEELAPFLDWLLLVGYELISTISTKLWEAVGTDLIATLMSKYQSNVYVFRFCWNQEPKPLDFLLGACHSIDVPFFLGNVGEGEGFPYCNFAWTKENEPGRIELSNAIIAYISNFMRNGYPGDPDGLLGKLPRWSNYKDILGCERIIFDATNTHAVIYMLG